MSSDKIKIVPRKDLLVLCGGKCGSETLCKTFKKNGFHTLKVHGKNDFKLRFKYDGLINLINRSSLNKKFYIIDSYRTPIERKISSFFQNLKTHVPNYYNKKVEELVNIFNNKYLNSLANQHPIDIIMKKYNVKPFDEFNFEKKYVIREKGNIVFIKILFSDIKEWNNILSNIFNKKIIIYPHNLSRKKKYNILYEKFKNIYKVPVSFINKNLENDSMFKIYNSKKDQEEYINKWLEKSF